MSDSEIDTLLKGLGAQLADDMDEPVTVKSFADLDAARLAVYAHGLPDQGIGGGLRTLAVQCTTAGGDPWEHVVVIGGAEGALTASVAIGECKIMMTPLPPSGLVEYTFAEDGGSAASAGPWFLAPSSLDALTMYRASKFKEWKKLLEKPSCEAALKRMLQIGIITNRYDSQLLKTFPAEDEAKYQVTDDNGKVVNLPHPVTGCRIWNAGTGSYDAVDPHLDGAPAPGADAEKAWGELLDMLKDQLGAEAVEALMN